MAQENMCRHWQVLDDPRQGDTVCLECGVVLEQCIGQGGPGVYRKRMEDSRRTREEDGAMLECLEDMEASFSVAEERVRDVLQVLHMDNEEMVQRCVENFNRLYWWRKQRVGFRRSVYKENVALATAIWKQMIRQRMPRPISHLANLCGLDRPGPLLKAGKILNFNAKEEMELKGWYEYEEAPPQDYLWTLCAYMSLPFWLPACAAQLATAHEVEERLSGVNPVHLAAGCLVSVGAKFQAYANLTRVHAVCETLGCSIKPVRKVIQKMPEFELDFENEMEEVGQNWLVQRSIKGKASDMKVRVKQDEEQCKGIGVRVEFKKSKRQELLERRRLEIQERAKERRDASQKRWQHLTTLTSWLQGELAKDPYGSQTASTDGWSYSSGSAGSQGDAVNQEHDGRQAVEGTGRQQFFGQFH